MLFLRTLCFVGDIKLQVATVPRLSWFQYSFAKPSFQPSVPLFLILVAVFIVELFLPPFTFLQIIRAMPDLFFHDEPSTFPPN